MKLELRGPSIMLCASLILLAGCKQKTGLEILNVRMAGMKALKSQYLVQHKGEKGIIVDFIFSSHTRVLATTSDFVIGCNEVDGHFESSFADKVYDAMPWDGKAFPGTGKLISSDYVTGGPVSANPPDSIAKATPWKLESKSGSIERYSKTVQTQKGPQTFKLEVDESGKPVKFEAPGDIVYITKSFEIVDEIPITKFHFEPREGFICNRIQADLLNLQTGEKFDFSKFSSAPDAKAFRLEEKTLFAVVDPKEPSSKNALSWINKAGATYKKMTISVGDASSGFFDLTGDLIRKITTSTPMFILVDKDSTIIGLWLGFDPENTKGFESDILKAIG
jgi:hypothetical protein